MKVWGHCEGAKQGGKMWKRGDTGRGPSKVSPVR